jgi:DNA-directed RNA polymerase subunit alpha
MNVLDRNWRSLIETQKHIEPTINPLRSATLVLEPLERGFGMTLGNALRRVLLSSLLGAAVKAIRIDGVLHEFSSIPGVREDVTDIVLNVKQLALRYQGEGEKRLALMATGPGEVTAGQIQTTGDIEIANPDLVICTLDDGAKLSMELIIDSVRFNSVSPFSISAPLSLPIPGMSLRIPPKEPIFLRRRICLIKSLKSN